MKRTDLKRYYFEALVYRGNKANVTRHTRREKVQQVHITETSELRARRCVLDMAWTGGLYVLEITLVRSKYLS